MRRALLWTAAVLFFAWEQVAMALWLRQVGGPLAGLAHAWSALREDWLVLLVLTDGGVFAICALVWLWRDLRRQGASRGARTLWFAGAVIFGCPALLGYLAERGATQAWPWSRDAHTSLREHRPQ
jgi:hypothetical protein